MLSQMSQVIDQATPQIPDRLWPPQAVARMKNLVERFPAVGPGPTVGSVSLGILCIELRLGEGEAQVDLSMPVLKEDRDAMIELASLEHEGRWLREDFWWSRLHTLCRRWADDQDLIGRHVTLLWLELDVLEQDLIESRGEVPKALPAPGVFVGFSESTTRCTDARTRRELLNEIAYILAAEKPATEVFTHLATCLEALPSGAFLQYFGFMLSRGSGVLRFVFARIPNHGIRPFLEAVGWPGDPLALEEKLRDLTTDDGETIHPGQRALQIDVTAEGVLPRLGLEFPFDPAPQSGEGRVAEERFLRNLTKRGLCTEEKLEALLELPGKSVRPWREVYRIGHTRQIHHVKLVVGRTGEVEAKVYYGRFLAIDREPGAPAPDAAMVSAALKHKSIIDNKPTL